MKVYLIRHGESEANLDNTIYDRIPNPDIELTPKGFLQAKQLAQRLSKRFGKEKTGIHVVSSPYKRTWQTANEIAILLGCEIEVNELLIEREFGDAIGQNVIDYVANRPKQLSLYNKIGDMYYRPPQGESKLDVIQRGLLFRLAVENKEYDHLIVVSHQATLKLFHNHVLGLLPLEENDWSNCCCRTYDVVHCNWKFRSADLV